MSALLAKADDAYYEVIRKNEVKNKIEVAMG